MNAISGAVAGAPMHGVEPQSRDIALGLVEQVSHLPVPCTEAAVLSAEPLGMGQVPGAKQRMQGLRNQSGQHMSTHMHIHPDMPHNPGWRYFIYALHQRMITERWKLAKLSCHTLLANARQCRTLSPSAAALAGEGL